MSFHLVPPPALPLLRKSQDARIINISSDMGSLNAIGKGVEIGKFYRDKEVIGW